jgi:hypothetical protein
VSAEEDVQVEQDEKGWAIKQGAKRLKRIAEGREKDGLQRACKWAWEYASEHGVTAWLRLQRGNRRLRINFNRSHE